MRRCLEIETCSRLGSAKAANNIIENRKIYYNKKYLPIISTVAASETRLDIFTLVAFKCTVFII